MTLREAIGRILEMAMDGRGPSHALREIIKFCREVLSAEI